jgi:protein O-mannosyl-transferase
MMSPDSRYRIGLAAILAAAGLLFAPSLRFPFIWDDTAVVRDNPFIHTPGPAGIYFNPRYWKSLVPVSRSDYRPLQMLTLAAISRVGGRDPFPYRAVNLALHFLATIMVFILGQRLGAGRAAALLASAFFAFHPVHVETIVGARNLAELMASVLLFSTLFFFPRGDGRGRGVVSFLLFAAALLYKENALILPPLLTILVMTGPGGFRKNQAALVKTLPFWILAVAAGIGKMIISPGPALSGPLPASHLIAGASRLLVTSARLVILPVRLRVLYHFPRPESWAQPVWFFSLAGAIILAGILVAARKHRLLFSLLLCLGVSLLPSLYRLGSAGRVVAEQRL